jgi:VanZ family protein
MNMNVQSAGTPLSVSSRCRISPLINAPPAGADLSASSGAVPGSFLKGPVSTLRITVNRQSLRLKNQRDVPAPKKDAMAVKAKYWLPVFLCMGVIFYFSSLPGSDIPSLFPLQDVFFHGIIYATLGWLLRRALQHTVNLGKPHALILLTVLLGSLYGLSDEFHQSFVPGRSVSFIDWLVDAAGTFIGSIFFH